jgi:hypothetical protein
MNEANEDFDALMREHMQKVTILAALAMVAQMRSMMEEEAKKKLAEVLGREPTPEEYQYYQWLRRLKAQWQEAVQRQIDREKIYWLVMGG